MPQASPAIRERQHSGKPINKSLSSPTVPKAEIWKYLLCVNNVGEDRLFLIDLWKGATKFSMYPVDAHSTGYCWSTLAEAEWMKQRALSEGDVLNIGIIMVQFKRKDGRWEAVAYRAAS